MNWLDQLKKLIVQVITPDSVRAKIYARRMGARFNMGAHTYGAPVLRFWDRFDLAPNSDFGYLEVSTDGVNWTTVVANKPLTTIPTAATVGLFECSHKAGVLGTATFDNVSFTPGP